MVQYKLLNNGRGVILTRQPEIVEGAVFFTFEGTPAGATAIFITLDGKEYYRHADEACSVPASALVGETKVTVALLREGKQWKCEGLLGDPVQDGVLIAPNDADLPGNVADLQIQLHEVRESFLRLEARYEALNQRLTEMMEGYDLT